MPAIILSDGTKLNFPDAMSQGEISSAINKFTQEPQQTGTATLQEPDISQPVSPSAEQTPQINPPDNLPLGELDGDGKIPGNDDLIDVRGPASGIVGLAEGTFSLGSMFLASQVSKTAGFLKDLVSTSPPGTVNPEREKELVQFVQNLEEDLTVLPRTQPGQDVVDAFGDFIAPVADFFKGASETLGNKALEKFNSPTIAGLAAVFPELAAEVIPFGVVKTIKGVSGRAGRKAVKARAKDAVAALEEAAPTNKQLTDIAGGIYEELKNTGITVKPGKIQELSNRLHLTADEFGSTPKGQPLSTELLQLVDEAAQGGTKMPVDQLEKFRRIASNATRKFDNPSEQTLAGNLMDDIDEFLVNSKSDILDIPEGAPKNIAQNYEVARKLWRRKKKSEVLTDIMENIRASDKPFDQTMRKQVENLLFNKKRRNVFTKSEQAQLQKIKKGDIKATLAQIGSIFDIPSDKILIPLLSLGFASGTASSIGPLAATIPLVGRGAKILANRLTENRAKFADAVLRAGKDWQKITDAYLEATPVKLRDAKELSTLLLREDINLSGVPKNTLAAEARGIAQTQRSLLFGGGGGSAVGTISLSEDIEGSEPPSPPLSAGRQR